MERLKINDRPMTVVQIVNKNTSELDFSVPLLVFLKEKLKSCRVVLVYNGLDKRQFHRQGQFYKEVFRQFKVEEVDFIESMFFLPDFLKSILRFLYSRPYADYFGKKEAARILLKEVLVLSPKAQSFKNLYLALISYFLKLIETLLMKLISPKKILKKLNPDVVLFATRFNTEEIYNRYFESKNKIPIVLLPHSPHVNHPTEEMSYFYPDKPFIKNKGETKLNIPENVEYWCSFKHDQSWKNDPGNSAFFAYVGYPGFDSRWVSLSSEKREGKTKFSVLVVLRKYFPKGIEQVGKQDIYVIPYVEVFNYLKSIKSVLEETCPSGYKLVVKPHPGNNFKELSCLMKEVGIENYVVNMEPFYGALGGIDIVYSLFSTSLLIPVAYQVPVIVVESCLLNKIYEMWPLLKELYSNFTLYSRDHKELIKNTQQVFEGYVEDKVKKDLIHLRNFFPEGASEMGFQRLMSIATKDETVSNEKWDMRALT